MELKREEIEKLRTLLGLLEKGSGGNASSSNLAFTGITSISFNLYVLDKTIEHSWILHSRATDHMILSSTKFLSYKPCPSTKKVVLVDGSLTTVAGLGDIFIDSNLILRGVLHVPKLCTNLVSIQKLTHDANCHAIFYPFYCEFQEKESRKMIGRARIRNDLYHLEDPSGKNKRGQCFLTSFLAKSNKDEL